MQLPEPDRRYKLLLVFVMVCSLQAGRCSDEAVSPTILSTMSESSHYNTNALNSTQTDNGTMCSSTHEPVGRVPTIRVNEFGENFDNSYYINGSRLNGSDSNMTFPAASDKATSWWLPFRSAGVIIVASTGVVANTLTVVTLTVNGRAFSRLTAILLKHQAILDLSVCTLACGVFLQTSVWNTGERLVDFVVCFLWHSQFFYWTAVFLSTWNLVFIAVDRLIAVCFPMKRKNLSSTQIKMAIAGMYVPCMILACPCFTYVNYKNGRCALGSFMSPDMHYNINYWGSIIDLFMDYVCPVALFVILYGRIVLQLHRHRNAIKSNVQSEALTVSAIRVTKCAIAVTVIFIVSMSFHSIYYCFGSVGVISFDFRGPMHLFGILMTLVNSFANPFLYAIFMPAFRRSIRATICRRRNEVQDEGTLDTPGNTA